MCLCSVRNKITRLLMRIRLTFRIVAAVSRVEHRSNTPAPLPSHLLTWVTLRALVPSPSSSYVHPRSSYVDNSPPSLVVGVSCARRGARFPVFSTHRFPPPPHYFTTLFLCPDTSVVMLVTGRTVTSVRPRRPRNTPHRIAVSFSIVIARRPSPLIKLDVHHGAKAHSPPSYYN